MKKRISLGLIGVLLALITLMSCATTYKSTLKMHPQRWYSKHQCYWFFTPAAHPTDGYGYKIPCDTYNDVDKPHHRRKPK
jgi:hypothetical protein